MKFTINAKTFANALSQQLRVINAKNALMILDNFKIEAVGTDYLIITASDQEITSHITIEAKVQEVGTLCVSARELTDIVRKLGDKQIDVIAAETTNEFEIKCGKGLYKLTYLPAEEYPQRELPHGGYFKMPTETIINGFNATRNAVSSETIRPTITGVYMNILDAEAGGGVDFVASDTHQLVKFHSQETLQGVEPRGVIIPSKTVNLFLTTFAKYPEVRIALTERNITFQAEDAVLSSTLIVGTYPNYNRVIPGTYPYSLKVNRKEMLEVVNRVSGFANKATNLLKLEDTGMMELKVVSCDYDYNRGAEDYVMADGNFERKIIGVSSEYFTRILNVFSEDEVTLLLTDPARPIVISENGVTALVMPIQVID